MKTSTRLRLVGVLLTLTATVASADVGRPTGEEPVIGGPCEGCELVFDGLPDRLTTHSKIASDDEPGERLVIEGTVRGKDGKPAPGIVVYAYHTDSEGVYPSGTTRHGRLRGWAITDDHGTYRFETIRPGAYPSRRVAQHVHMHVIEPGVATYYIDSIHFLDDPLLTADDRNSRQDRGGTGLVDPGKDENGTWHVRRDIVLRLNVD